jgi:hypothetical protein
MQSSSLPRVPNGPQLVEQTRDFAARLYSAVGDQYLAFRRQHFKDPNPSLATLPPRNADVLQTEGARIAAGTLRIVPQEIRRVPILRDILDHLQWEVDINTLTERERLELHNVTMTYLYGITGGVQPWFVEWMLASAHSLAGKLHPDYYLAFPWHGLFYRSPDQLVAFDRAVAGGQIEGIEQEMQRLGGDLVKVLRDPLHTQPELAFTGPDAERRHALFNLKTTAGLALGAYLAAELVHDLITPRQNASPPQSVLPDLPSQITSHVLPDETRG